MITNAHSGATVASIGAKKTAGVASGRLRPGGHLSTVPGRRVRFRAVLVSIQVVGGVIPSMPMN